MRSRALRPWLGAVLAVFAGSSAATTAFRLDLYDVGEYYEASAAPLGADPLVRLDRYRVFAALRPDLRWQSSRWLLLARPRADASWTHLVNPPPGPADRSDTQAYVHEALVRFRPVKGLYLSLGRENLQWGPSYLLSVSNPFNPANGRNDPLIEVPGLDYGRITWLPSPHWSIGAIANISAHKPEHVGAYPQQYAFKLDYNGNSKYFSLIPSWREPAPDTRAFGSEASRDYRVGAYAGWTVNEAWLLYAEGSYRHLRDAYALLGGTAYTFKSGTNLALEYYRNDAGCTQKPYAQCFAAAAPGAPAVGPQAATPLGLGRKNYLLLQVLDRGRFKRWDFTLRWIEGLDDNSGQLIGIAALDASRDLRVSFIGAKFLGRADSEGGSVLRSFASLGLRWSF